MRPADARPQGEIGQGGGLAGGGPVVALRGWGSGLEGAAGQVGGLRPRRGGGQGLWPVG